MISATLDTSVYIRALHLGGAAALLIGHARAGKIRIDISDPILSETIRVLRDKFQWNGYMLQNARAKLLSISNHVSPAETVNLIKEAVPRRSDCYHWRIRETDSYARCARPNSEPLTPPTT